MTGGSKQKERSLIKKLKRAALCAMLLVLTVLLCGCMKMHIEIVWNEDNSASISVTIGLQKSALTMMDMSDDEIRQQLKESMDDGEDYSFKDFSDSDYTGITATLNVKDITKQSSNSVEGLNFKCTESGKTKTYSVTGSIDGSDVAGDSEGLEESGISLDSIDMKLSIKMPGKITSNNATEVKGNVLTWVLLPTSKTTISAVSEGSGGGGALPVILLVAGIVVLAGVAVVALLLIRKNKAAQTASYAYGEQAPGYNPYQAPGVQPQYVQPQYQPPEQPQYVQPQYQPPEQPQYQPQYQPAEQPQYQQPAEQAPAVTRCPQCGAELAPNAKFCTTCGASISG